MLLQQEMYSTAQLREGAMLHRTVAARDVLDHVTQAEDVFDCTTQVGDVLHPTAPTRDVQGRVNPTGDIYNHSVAQGAMLHCIATAGYT